MREEGEGKGKGKGKLADVISIKLELNVNSCAALASEQASIKGGLVEQEQDVEIAVAAVSQAKEESCAAFAKGSAVSHSQAIDDSATFQEMRKGGKEKGNVGLFHLTSHAHHPNLFRNRAWRIGQRPCEGRTSRSW